MIDVQLRGSDQDALMIVASGSIENPVDLDPTIARIASDPKFAKVRAFAIVEPDAANARVWHEIDDARRPAKVTFSTLAPIWRFTRLDVLSLIIADGSAVASGAIHAPEMRNVSIRVLHLRDPYAPTPLLVGMASAHWPQLESLSIELAEEHWGGVHSTDGAYLPIDPRHVDPAASPRAAATDWREIEPLVRSLHATRIRRLALHNAASVKPILKALVLAGLPPTLEELDLSLCAITDRDWRTAVIDRRFAASLVRLKRLVLDGTSVSSVEIGLLAKAGVVVSCEPLAPQHRYMLAIE